MTATDNLLFKMDKMWADSEISLIVDKVKDAEGFDEGALKSTLANTFQAAEEQLQDGFQLLDIVPILAAALADIMQAVKVFGDGQGAAKLAFVTNMFTELYNFIDKGADGTKNRIDIPWLPQVAEDFLEERVLPVAIRFGIEAAYAMWKKNRNQ